MEASLILEKSRNPIFGYFHSFEREVRKRPPASKKQSWRYPLIIDLLRHNILQIPTANFHVRL